VRVLTIETRALGRRRPLLPSWQLPIPPEPREREEPLTLRALITRIVAEEVAAFRERQKDRRFVRVLSERQLSEGALAGRIDPAAHERVDKVDANAAVATALIGFEDGLYLVVIDGKEHRDLDEQVIVGPDTTVTFLRLVMLSGA
jgi:hypothetical protein